jgi:phosphatidylinositol alpha 1,6-mannosyltransferase
MTLTIGTCFISGYLVLLSIILSYILWTLFLYSPWIFIGLWFLPQEHYCVLVTSILFQYIQSPLPAIFYYVLFTWLHHDNANRILMTGDAFKPKVDGISIFNGNVISRLIQRGYTVHVVTAVPGPNIIHGATVYRSEQGFTLPDHPTHLIGFLTPDMVCSILRFRPSVVHVWEGYGILSSQVIVLCAILGIRCVTSIHTKVGDYAILQWPAIPQQIIHSILWLYGQTILRMTSCTFVVSLTENIHVPRPQFLPSGVDSELFSPARHSSTLQKEIGIKGGKQKWILHVGRFHREKRVHDMIPIFQRVHTQMGNVMFVFVGEGIEEESLQNRCDSLGLPTLFCGTLFGKELAMMYASSDVFFSACDTEAFGLVFMEALSSGLIPVGARAGAIRTLYEENVHGYKYTVSNIEEASQAILKVLSEPSSSSSHREMKRRGRLLAEEHTWEKTVDTLIKSF